MFEEYVNNVWQRDFIFLIAYNLANLQRVPCTITPLKQYNNH
jgi:hypothetical protein